MKPELRLELQQKEPQGCMSLLPPVVRAVIYRIRRIAKNSWPMEKYRDWQDERQLQKDRDSWRRHDD